MATLNVPSRSDYTVQLLVGTKISATVTVASSDIAIEPAKSATQYSLVESTSSTGGLAAFPVVI